MRSERPEIRRTNIPQPRHRRLANACGKKFRVRAAPTYHLSSLKIVFSDDKRETVLEVRDDVRHAILISRNAYQESKKQQVC